MNKHYRMAPHSGRWTAMWQGVCRTIGVLRAVAAMLVWLLVLPVSFWRWCIDAGVWWLRTFVRTIFGLLGLGLIVTPLLGCAYVLLYPWIK